MSDLKVAMGFLAAIISLGGFVCYCYDIKKRNTQPNVVSWFIWLLLAIMLGYSYYASGARETVLIYVASVIGNSCVIIMAIKRGNITWNKRDVYYLLTGVLIVAVWKISGSPQIAQYSSLSLHLIGAIPTFKKTWEKPHDESILAWFVFNVANMINILAIKKWVVKIYLSPIYLAAHSTAMVLLLFIFQKKRKEGDV